MDFQWRDGTHSASLSTFKISSTTILLPSADKWTPSLEKSEGKNFKIEGRNVCYFQFKSTTDIQFTFFMIAVVVKGEDNTAILNHSDTYFPNGT
jgi:hypothetical protein